MSQLGHNRACRPWIVMSALLRLTDSSRTSRHVRKVPILLQKSFLGEVRKFLGPLMRFGCDDVRDHVVLPKSDHGLSWRRHRVLGRQRSLKIAFREILGVVRFSTFATVSANFGSGGLIRSP